MGVNIDIWDPGDPPQPFSVWYDRWENPSMGDEPLAAPTPRIARFAERYEEALAREGIDIETHLPEMNRNGRLEWWFNGDTVSAGKFLGDRAADAMDIAARIAREVGAVAFVGLEEAVPHGWEPAYPDAEIPEYATRTLYVVVPELAADGPEDALRRARWAEHRYGRPEPRLIAFLERLTARFATFGLSPGSSPTMEVPARDGTEHHLVQHQFTTRLPPSPHDWVVATVHEGRHRLEVSTDPLDTLGAQIEQATREVAEDLVVINTGLATTMTHFTAHLVPRDQWDRLGPEASTAAGPGVGGSAAAKAVLETLRSTFTTMDLLPHDGADTPDSVWFDTAQDLMVAEASGSGDVVTVFGSETEEGLHAGVLRCLAEARPADWLVVVTDERSAALLPEGVPYRSFGI
ncbi:hypothetical protein BJY21_001260 [Kineosphaera limosa]|nr:hypothetical protein [Kineosphaera limosa]NYE00076.1 hypothetical protein [Kineosphaera limosa]